MPSRTTPSDTRDPYDLTGLHAAGYYRVSRDDSGEEKSPNDQKAEAHRWAERVDVSIVTEFADVSLSASEFARKGRPGYQRLLAAIDAGRVNLLWLWALNRATRQDQEYLDLVKLCRARDVRWVIGGKVHDPNDDDDMLALDIHNIMDRRYSRKLSKDIRRGQKSAARAGTPHGLVPYGYRREYDLVTRRFVQQVPDDGPDGTGTAEIVREIFERLEAGEPFNTIRRDLTARGIPSPGTVSRHKRPPTNPRWTSRSLYVIARNHAYIGQRVYQGKVLPDVTAVWPPLVSEERFWAVQRLLTDTARQGKRPGLARHLLSYQVKCAVCDAPLAANSHKRGRVQGSDESVVVYTCWENRCAAILASVLDRYVQGRLLRWLSDPAVLADLTRVDDTEAAAEARADADRARVDLDKWRRYAEAGEGDPELAIAGARGAMARLEDAERRTRASAVPSVVAGVLGPDAADRWAALALPIQREIIRQVADIRVRPVGRGQRVHPAERVEWRWLIGPEPAEVAFTVAAGRLDPEEFYGQRGPKPGATAHPAVCEMCGKEFISARSTRVCSGTCKTRRSVQRRARAAAGA